MKNNREKLTRAFEELRGDTLGGVMNAMETPAVSRKTYTRRFVTLAAACLAAVMMLGAVMAVPFLIPDEPTASGTDQNGAIDTDFVIVVPEENYPFVRVQVLSAATDGEEEKEENVSVDTESNRIMLTFNLGEGEKVEITSHQTLNSKTAVSKRMEDLLLRIESMDFTDNALKVLERMLYREIRWLERNGEIDTELEPYRVMTQVSDCSFLVHKNLFRAGYLSDVVDFIIRNENGEIVGAGSVCLAVKMLYSSKMVRYEILGSKRFDTPLNDEEAAVYMDGLHEKTEATIAGMDFTPATAEEGYELAKIDIIKTCFGNGQVTLAVDSLWTNSAPFWDFRFHKIRGRAHEEERFFISFPDGTWGEISEDSDWVDEPCADESCPDGEAPHDHRVGRTLVLTDGRAVSIERKCYVDESGQALEKYVPVFVPAAESA